MIFIRFFLHAEKCHLLKVRGTYCKVPKFWVFHQISANGIANSEDPDPQGGVRTGSALFARTKLSKN